MENNSFEKWISEKCPDDVWVYRGQAAKYPGIIPCALRTLNTGLSVNRLANIDYHVAEHLLSKSPHSGIQSTLKGLTNPAIRHDVEGIQSYLLRDNDYGLSYSKFLRALGQHYGFHSCYVDLTYNPWVALAFATLNEDNKLQKGIVYRWPAKYLDNNLLCIGDIDIYDLTHIHECFLRPRLQSSLLALPVFLPPNNIEQMQIPGFSQLFPTPIDALNMVDLKDLSSCESYTVEIDKVPDNYINNLDVLFPNEIDLGYSYMTLIALCSIITYHPEDYDNKFLSLNQINLNQANRAMQAASIILDKECFRIDSSVPKTDSMSIPLSNATNVLEFQINRAFVAADQINSKEVKTWFQQNRQRLYKELFSKVSIDISRFLENSEIPIRVGYDINRKGFYIRFEDTEKPNSTWIENEVLKRSNLFRNLIKITEYLPVYAIEFPEKYLNYNTFFSVTDEYSNKIKYLLGSSHKIRSQITN